MAKTQTYLCESWHVECVNIILDGFFAGTVVLIAGSQRIDCGASRAVRLVVVLQITVDQPSGDFVSTGGHSLQGG